MRISPGPGAAQTALQANAQVPASWSAQEQVQIHQRDLAAQVGARIETAWAVRDQWQVIDQVGEFELGGAVNTTRHRTMAESGGAILEGLSRQGDGSDAAGGFDDSLLQAAQQWLAAAGTRDDDVGARSQPRPATLLTRQPCRIDLSRVVSRYIGETEKNLDTVFGRAERCDPALLFDEADALFGRRTDVCESHDRFASPQIGEPPIPSR